MADAPDEPNQFLLPCSVCSRTFRPEVLERHEKVCEKSQTKKRKVFDSFKCRVQGTELEEFLGPAPLPGQPVKAPVPLRAPPTPLRAAVSRSSPPKVPKWKQTHEALVATLRAARGEQVPPSSTTLSLVAADTEQCPTCGRKFGPRAYDRHVTFCREMMARKPRSAPKCDPAQERQLARTQYRAKATVNKWRPDVTACKLPAAQTPTPQRRNRSVATAPSQGSRQSATAPPLVTRHTATAPPLIARQSASASPLVARKSASVGSGASPLVRQSEQGGVRGSLRIRGVSTSKLSPNSTNNRDSSVRRRASAPSHGEQSKLNLSASKSMNFNNKNNNNNDNASLRMASITALADEQMRNLLSWSSDNDLTSAKISPSTFQASPTSPTTLQASPTSAFTPVVSSSSVETSIYGPNDNADHHIRTSTPIPNIFSGRERQRQSSETSVTSLAESLLDDINWNLPNLQNMPTMPPLNRSRKKTFARSQSVFEDRNRMLFLQTFPSDATSDDEDGEGEREGVQGEIPPPIHANKEGRGGGDSAYSSLTRRSPREEGPTFNLGKTGSKFCHECGAKFPVPSAKFCCDCGVRRLLI